MKQAPVKWLMEMNRMSLRNVFLVVGVVCFALGGWSVLAGGFNVQGLWIAAGGVCSLSTAYILHRRFFRRESYEMSFVLGIFFLVICAASTSMVLGDTFVNRARHHAQNAVLWKTAPSIFGFPLVHSAMLIAFAGFMDIASWEASVLVHADPPMRASYSVSVIYSIGWLGVAWMQARRLWSVFDAQQALAAEKVLMESIITMMCDAIVWLSESDGMILRADQRFDIMLGRPMTGRSVSDALPEEEQSRLQNCLSHAKTTPVLLPTTLVTKAGRRIPVEFFIVGNRDVKTDGQTDQTPGFLIGLRLCKGAEEQLPEADMNEEHSNLLESRAEPLPEDREDRVSAMSSVPETTATDRIFSKLEMDRLAGHSAELRHSLEEVVTLGQHQRWLLNPMQVEIAPQQILGAGSFGVVFCGWLHGSPIAVKTTKHSTDNVGVKHLVAIANEIRVLRHARHPNVVLFHGAVVEPVKGEVMLILERVRGPDLHRYVREHSEDADVFNRFQLLLDVACALRYLHAQTPQIVHGDLKSSNILVEPAIPRAKLVDFGLSRLLTKHVRPLGGTLDWMAPEIICRFTNKPNPNADVFSFGRLAYWIVACRNPLQDVRSKVIVDMAKKGITHPLEWQENRPLHRECSILCKKVLTFMPEQRPNMAEVHQEVSAWTLPDIEAKVPALELSKAEDKDKAKARGGGRLAAVASTLRELLSSAMQTQQQQQQQQQQGLPPPPPQAPQAPQGSPASRGDPTSSTPPASRISENPTGILPTTSGSVTFEQKDLALPDRRGTLEDVKKLMLMGATMQWNFPVLPGACCKYHAAVAELQRVAAELTRGECNHIFGPHKAHQCKSCGALDMITVDNCFICNKSTSSLSSPRMPSIQERGEEDEEQGAQSSARHLAAHLCSL